METQPQKENEEFLNAQWYSGIIKRVIEMPKSEAKKRSDAKYDKKTYEQLNFKVRRDAEINGNYIRAHAIEQGESINGFINRAVKETIERDRKKII